MNEKVEAPKLTLPSGGGAMRGIGEPFKSQDFTGASGFSVPIALTSARGMSPSLNLDYNSGNGNGAFGLGFAMALDSITLKTSTGIPKYDGNDVYILGSAGELVPAYTLDQEKGWLPDVQNWTSPEGVSWSITAYRPRTESGWSRIERWEATVTGVSHWRVVTAGNEVTTYGRSPQSRIFDPAQPQHVFEWLMDSTEDSHGNRVEYLYREEDVMDIPSLPYNVGRNQSTQRYLWEVRYGNYSDPNGSTTETCWAYRVCLDYGQIDADNPQLGSNQWTCRPDPFSSYKSGFEIRTWRLCRGIYLFAHFTGVNDGIPYPIRATLLHSSLTAHSALSQVHSIVERGYRIAAQLGGALLIQDSPALELEYQEFLPEAQQWKALEAQLPGLVGQGGFIPVDLEGVGMDGLLWSDEASTLYLKPLGKGRFSEPELVPHFPVYRDFTTGQVSFTSVNGNGILDLVVSQGSQSGWFSHGEGPGWSAWHTFQHLPADFSNPDKEWVDVDGSGMPSILLFDNEFLKTYASEGALGYAAAKYSKRPPLFPSTSNTGKAEVSSFADVFGDGLPHRVRIRNGQVEAWPCLGHGTYGEMVVLGNAPNFPEGLDINRLRLIDTDGSGTVDIVYMMEHAMRLWVNQCGNAFSEPIDIPLPSAYGSLSQVTPGDFTGYGTASLLLTQLAPQVHHSYYDFAGVKKPYLLRISRNGMGGETEATYTTSTLECLRDLQEGRPWPTKLPFPVHVNQKSIVRDHVTGAHFTSRHRYHDGYFDPIEREFRGFGFVESWDTEDYEEFASSSTLPEHAAELLDKNLWVPPVHTKSWFLTGAYISSPALLETYQREAFQGDPDAWTIAPYEFDPSLDGANADVLQQAYSALAGSPIRSEVYAIDGSPVAEFPYSVALSSVSVRLLQPQLGQRYVSLQVLQGESLNYAYDRVPIDPLISQGLPLLHDAYGNALLSAAVAYPRRQGSGPWIYPEQAALHCVVSQAEYINSVNPSTSPLDFWQILGVNWQTRSYEIGGLAAPDNAPFTIDVLREKVLEALQQPISAQEARPETPWSRLLSWAYDLYWNADQTAALPQGEITGQALGYGGMAAVITDEELLDIFGDRVDAAFMQCQGGYVLQDGYWWNPGLTQYYAGADQFFLPMQVLGPEPQAGCSDVGLGTKSTVGYDPYLLFQVTTSSYITPDNALTTTAVIDYPSLQAWQTVDANGMVSEVMFDPMGQVVVTTAYGTIQGQPMGNQPLSAYVWQPQQSFQEVIDNPKQYLQGASTFYFYDLFAWQNPTSRQPVNAIGLSRMDYVTEFGGISHPTEASMVQVGITYSDGLGNILQAKAKTGPGPITLRKGQGTVLNPQLGTTEVPPLVPDGDSIPERWLVTGRTVYNNKGQPTETYNPYFSDTPLFESQQEIIDQGLVPPPSITQYDPLGRVVKQTTPKGFFSKAEFSPWESKSYDLNDTVLDSAYYKWFISTYPNPSEPWQVAEKAALDAAAKCYNTPATVIMDNLGRAIRSIGDNLGAVGRSSIPAAVAAPMTPEGAWESLVQNGYLMPDVSNPSIAWVTDNFQPYWPGFDAQFRAQYLQNGIPLLEWLRPSKLTSMAVYDIQGQVVANADPRLFAEMLRTGEPQFNFTYRYNMAGAALKSVSADAGTGWSLSNILGSPISTWDSRGTQLLPQYDNLQRPTANLVIQTIDGRAVTATSQVIIYGDSQPEPSANNMNGRVYQQYDESGLGTVFVYGLGGQALQTHQQVRRDFVSEADWTPAAMQRVQEEPYFAFFARYNAQGALLEQTYPDGSKVSSVYNLGGRLMEVWQDPNSNPDNVPIEQVLGYDANGNRTLVRYGNGVQSRFTYDEMTQALVAVRCTRPNPNGNGTEVIRDLQFTYDPMGHKTAQTDRAAAALYPTKPELAGNLYQYDLLYHLISATGKTLPGLNHPGADKSVPVGVGHHYAPLTDLQQMEGYTRSFAYDSGGNLIMQRHRSDSGSWTQTNFIASGSNRLRTVAYGSVSDSSHTGPDLQYDANGNLLNLYPGSKAQVAWNYRNQIAHVTQIARSVQNENGDWFELNDREYYVYDSSGTRSRKVTMRMQQGGTKVQVTDKLYFGAYEVKRVYVQDVNLGAMAAGLGNMVAGNLGAASGTITSATNTKLVSELVTLAVTDGNTTLARTSTWVQAPDRERGPQTGDVQTRYMLHDSLGSVTVELTVEAEVISLEEYYPYGGTSFTLARNQLEAESKEYRFCGKECDGATGLYDYGARYYATWLCRWMSPDPAGTEDGSNLYAYVGGDPVGYDDPSGMNRRKAASARKKAKSDKPNPRKVSERKDTAKYSLKKDNTINERVVRQSQRKRKRDGDDELEQKSFKKFFEGMSDKPETLGKTKKPPKFPQEYVPESDRKKFPTRSRTNGFGKALSRYYSKWNPKKPIKFGFNGVKITHYWNGTTPFVTGGGSAPADYKELLDMLFKNQDQKALARKVLNRDYKKMTDSQKILTAKLEVIVGIAEEFRKKGAVELFIGTLSLIANGTIDYKDYGKYFHFSNSDGGAENGREQVAKIRLMIEGNPIKATPEMKTLFGVVSQDDDGYDSSDEEVFKYKNEANSTIVRDKRSQFRVKVK